MGMCISAVWRARLALFCILLIAGGLRFYHLSLNVPELFNDEIQLYDEARSIAVTGFDLDGTLKPFLYAGWTRNAPMYAIATYASSSVFGKNPLGQRFPAAVFGLITIILLYKIMTEITGRQSISLVAAFLCAILPEFIHFSRIGWEPASELPFLLGGLYALLRAFRLCEEESKLSFERLVIAALLLALTTYTYMGAWFYVIILGGSLIFLNRSKCSSVENGRKLLGAAAVWAATATPAFLMMFTDPLTYSRRNAILTFKNGFSNEALHTFLANYVAHYGWPYLFGDGSSMQKYLAGVGELYWWMGPLMILGVIYAEKYVKKEWMFAWLWVWILAYPLGGSLTNDFSPHAPRTLAAAPILCMLGAFGFIAFLDLSKFFTNARTARLYVPVAIVTFLITSAFSVFSFCDFYFTMYPRMSAVEWESGTSDLFAAIRADSAKYKRICFGELPHIGMYAYYYLEDVPLKRVWDIRSSECFDPGTLLASKFPIARSGFTVVSQIQDLNRMPFAVLQASAPAENNL